MIVQNDAVASTNLSSKQAYFATEMRAVCFSSRDLTKRDVALVELNCELGQMCNHELTVGKHA
jgi:hypothetical protein